MRDRGSMMVFTVLVGLAFTSAALVALVPLFDEIGARQQAQNAADAAALAGVTGGRVAAADLAAANGGNLVVWERQGRTVTVTVAVAGRTALARATDAP
jgi:hypothetical protein